MDGSVRVLFKMFHTLTWPPLMHDLA